MQTLAEAAGPSVRALESAAERPLALYADEPGIVRRFLAWRQRADAGERAEAASALARAYLYSDLSADERAEAELGLVAVLDDPSALVRRALAEALAGAFDAPRPVVLALAADQSDVAAVVLGRSPLLTEAELVDFAAAGDAAAQSAVARRPRLPAPIAAALAEVSRREAAIALADNLDADLRPSALWRLYERFADDAEVRDALASRPNLPSALRNELAAATAAALAEFVARCDWLSPERAQRIARDAREKATATIVNRAGRDDLAEIARHMRSTGTLTVAVLMRALLGGNRDFFVQALSELSGLALRRAAALTRAPKSQGFAALYAKAHLPEPFLPAFRAALIALECADPQRGDQLSRALCEKVIAACDARAEVGQGPMLALLWRFASEAARECARDYADAAWRAPPPPRLERPNYAPLLIEAVAAALEELDAPVVEAPAQMESSLAPPVEFTVDQSDDDAAAAPPVQLPADMLAALAEAA
jgi:uncharacterized protein (DUF2336 family)